MYSDNRCVDSGVYSDNRSLFLDGMYIGDPCSNNVSFVNEKLFQSASVSWGRFSFEIRAVGFMADLCQISIRVRSGFGGT